MRRRVAVLGFIAIGIAILSAAALGSLGVAAPSGPQIIAQGAPSAATPVDVEVVLAVDVSYSMDPDEQQL